MYSYFHTYTQALVTHRQRKYFRNKWNEREMADGPWVHVVTDTPTSRCIRDLVSNDTDDVGISMTLTEQQQNLMHLVRRRTHH